MKKLMLLGALAVLVTSSDAQSPAPDESQQLQALLKEVQAQQIQLEENQVKIDAKLVTLAEAIRIAKIYASRGGR
jgi:outer membrane lipoprotein-sorting protein